ncbi:hypothetical protein X350_03445 [Oenococcus oeni S12]|nr:hypothetical protein X350_03445 [Oenococcus oeni S12]
MISGKKKRKLRFSPLSLRPGKAKRSFSFSSEQMDWTSGQEKQTITISSFQLIIKNIKKFIWNSKKIQSVLKNSRAERD